MKIPKPDVSNNQELSDTKDQPDDIVLQIASTDRLSIAWGGTVVRKTSVPPPPFGDNDTYWLLLVTQGLMKATIGGSTFTISRGQTLFLLCGEMCQLAESHHSKMQFHWIAFRINRGRGSKRTTINVPRVATPADFETMTDYLRLLTEEYHTHQFLPEPSLVTTLAAHYLLLATLGKLDPAEPRASRLTSASSVLAERAKDYIRINLSKQLTTSTVARALDCSANHLSAVFREACSESPVHYIQRVRVNVSLGPLVTSRMSISEIALAVGFPNLNYYSRVFRRYHGISPSAYRNAHSHLFATSSI